MWTGKANAYERVATEPIGWLTTVSQDGVPSTAPVWFFLEEDNTITIYSRDPSIRVRNVKGNGRVTLHLEGDGRGGAIVVLNGTAAVADDAPPADEHAGFVAKYQSFLDQYQWTPQWFAEHYPTALRLTVSSIRGN
ncbi:MAG: pyridoxamine 5'-phosphate oxidase family protein [Acidimicrobiia bacterium]